MTSEVGPDVGAGPQDLPAVGARASPAAPEHPQSHRGLPSLAAAAILWGTIGLVVRLLQDRGWTSGEIAFWRLVVASVALVPLLRPAAWRGLTRQLRRPGPLLRVSVGSLAFQLFYFLAVRDVGVGVATLVTLGLAPVAATVGQSLVARSRPSARTVGVLIMALAGLTLVTVSGAPSAQVAPRPVLGIVESVASALAFAASTAWSGPLSRALGPLVTTFATSALGFLLLLPVVVVGGRVPPTSAADVGGIVWLGVMATVVAYGLFYVGLRSTSPAVALVVTLLEPVTAVVLAAVVLSEPLTGANVVGGTLLLASIVVLYLQPRRRG